MQKIKIKDEEQFYEPFIQEKIKRPYNLDGSNHNVIGEVAQNLEKNAFTALLSKSKARNRRNKDNQARSIKK